MQTQMEKLAQRPVRLISNGYAPSDFQSFVHKTDPHFTILHTGSINKDRNPGALWSSLGAFVKQNPDFAQKLRIRLIGALDASALNDLERFHLTSYTHFETFVPHEKVIEELASCSLLLLPLNNVKSQKGIVTGKVFEYLASEQPILAIGPSDGDAAAILKQQAGTFMVDFDTPIPWPAVLEMCAHKPQRKATLTPFSRRELSKAINQLLVELTHPVNTHIAEKH
jgi:hypothetical protein